MTKRSDTPQGGPKTRPQGSETDAAGSSLDPAVEAAGAALLGVMKAQGPPKKRKRRRRKPNKATARKKGQIDLGSLLQEPLQVLIGGKPGKIDPLEAAVRRQVQKALSEKSLASIKAVIDLAIKHRLIVTAPERRRGGVLVIPKTVPEEQQAVIFSHPGPPMAVILQYLEWHYEQRSAGNE